MPITYAMMLKDNFIMDENEKIKAEIKARKAAAAKAKNKGKKK